MATPLRLFASFAHPDDESLGVGGTLARYAGEAGVEVTLLTATYGDRGRYKGVREGDGYPGREGMAKIREGELLFDYTIRPGIAKNKNATFLMKKMGII